MKTERFEQRLQEQPLRQPPAEWRREILGAARLVNRADDRLPATAHGWSWVALRQWLWPCPEAWAALAAAWIASAALSLATPSTPAASPEPEARLRPERIRGYVQERQLLSRLLEPAPPSSPAAAPAPAVVPRPRTFLSATWRFA
jgi:hypothetical protein